MKNKSNRLAGVVVLLVCFTCEAIHGAEADDQSAQPLGFDFGNEIDEPSDSAAERCYQTVLDQRSELDSCSQAIAEASLFNDRGRVAAYTNRALIQSHSGNHEAALVDLDQALEILPHLPAVLINRGNVLWRLRRYEEASESYQRAIDESGGRSALAYYNRIFVHRVRGDVDLAASDLETARWLVQAEAQFEPGTTMGEHLLPEGLFQQ